MTPASAVCTATVTLLCNYVRIDLTGIQLKVIH